jgi:hypothetical protein
MFHGDASTAHGRTRPRKRAPTDVLPVTWGLVSFLAPAAPLREGGLTARERSISTFLILGYRAEAHFTFRPLIGDVDVPRDYDL